MVKVTLSKFSRDQSFKGRFAHHYGYNSEYFDVLCKYKDDWSDKLFFVNEQMAKKYVELAKPIVTIMEEELNLAELSVTEMTSDDIQLLFTNDIPMKITYGKETHEVNLTTMDNTVDLTKLVKRNALILSPGGHITSLKWLPQVLKQDTPKVNYLAVSIINNPNGVGDSILNPELSMYDGNTTDHKINSAIQIWKHDLNTNELTLEHMLVTTNLGATCDLTWCPMYLEEGNVLGVLAASFTDGKLHLFRITKNLPQYAKVDQTSLSYVSQQSSEPQKSDPCTNIISFEFLGIDKILVGTTDGSIAEYILPFKRQEENIDDISIPSYKTKISDEPITSIVAAEYGTGEYIILINTISPIVFSYDYNNYIQDFHTPISRSTLPPSYNHVLRTFTVTPTVDSVGYIFLRSPQETMHSLLKLDSYLTSNHASEILGHPLNLSGTMSGQIIVLNYSRKILNGQKTTNRVLVPLQLWKFDEDEDKPGTVVLQADFGRMVVDTPVEMSIMPPELAISALAWNENVHGSSIYAAGTVSGVLIIERLDPKYRK
ncbi:uncharacterized protein SPAPADRAFT_142526 [Spathaspora passalidarum NRRL Y-27907]|uniref:Uncharacterized protein n=1 Tax=Spathaspora passalidarum (strain NRRL Y-27907 / 11-Y1) TaxID=619300 RepID=G3ATB8_SPAPN|nr:uncharacterized protein SPAPADRAFT_142526 [Spathaspora passalidarum NRRL Y-27907]EGW30881.1 hypothetical protein SPAPADRAFT_142526 [Spathaspora passalidarum NRRL Y-27907]